MGPLFAFLPRDRICLCLPHTLSSVSRELFKLLLGYESVWVVEHDQEPGEELFFTSDNRNGSSWLEKNDALLVDASRDKVSYDENN